MKTNTVLQEDLDKAQGEIEHLSQENGALLETVAELRAELHGANNTIDNLYRDLDAAQWELGRNP